MVGGAGVDDDLRDDPGECLPDLGRVLMNQRYITVILPNGDYRTWFPPHVPVSQENDSGMVFVWENPEGLIQNLAINTEVVAVLEMGIKQEDVEPEVLDLINQAKQREEEDANESGGVTEVS